MRLIDGGPDRVELFPEVVGADDDGNPVRVPSVTPVVLDVQLHRLRAEESAAFGQADRDYYYFNTSQDVPAGAYASATARGRTWDVEGAPQRQGRSSRTAHAHVVLSSRKPVI